MRQASRALVTLVALLALVPSARAADSREAWSGLETRLSTPPPAPRTDLPPSDITLVWYDPMGALPAGLDVMTGEAREIFNSLGVRVAWRDGQGGTFGAGPTPEVAVILLPDDPVPERVRERVLGLILKKQEPNRSMWLFLSNVRWTLGLDPRRKAPAAAREWRDVGLALGRVLAHELIHAVVPDEPHADGGLMHHSLNRGFLLGGPVAVDRRCAGAFLTRLGLVPATVETPESARFSGP